MTTPRKPSRRDFLRLAALGSGSVALSGLLSSCRVEKIPTSTPEGEMDETETETEGDTHSVSETEEPEGTNMPAEEHQMAYSSIEALNLLLEGNHRFVDGSPIHPRRDATRRSEILSGQNPFAVILTCSDSRVIPETLFDQGLGDLFVIRTAGNVVDRIGLGSIEYAVEHLAVPLLVVLGHQHCGAVTAAVEGSEAPGHIHAIVEKISPAVAKARELEGDLLSNAIDTNIADVVEELRNSQPILSEFTSSNRLEIIGMRYDMDSGVANFTYY